MSGGGARPGRAAARRIAVTGAGGFVGGRLAELLEAAPGGPAVVRLVRRRPGGTAVVVALDDEAALRAVLQGCDAVVHCAFDGYDEAFNLGAADALGAACAALGLRLVHLSSAAVYEPLPDGVLSEHEPSHPPLTAYQAVKRDVERRLLSRVGQGLDLVILQPTIVYGPHGGAWTDGPARELLTGEVLLPDAGRGLCNAVFVDDVCAAAIAACSATLASGERILVSGPGPVTWHGFFGAHATAIGAGRLRLEQPGRSPPPGAMPPAASGGMGRGGVGRRLRRALLGPLGARGRTRLNLLVHQLAARVRGPRTLHAQGARRALLEARCTVSNDKAGRLLGYAPRFSFEAGMAATAGYLAARYRS